jgi:hypothetical protein
VHSGTEYGKLSKDELLQELGEVSATLASRLKEVGALQEDLNNSWYPAYAQSASGSVAAKEREAEFACLDLMNEKMMVQAEIAHLTVLRDCLVTVINAS